MFRQTKRRVQGRKNFETGVIYQSTKINSLYGSRLSFYDIPPLEEITLEEFESWAIDRLKVLIEIESCIARSKPMKEIENLIKPLLLKYLPLSPTSKDENITYNERKKDHYSHYILKLVFCRNEELRTKFVKNEVILFKIRYNLLQPQEQRQFIKSCGNLPWEYITDSERLELLKDLTAASHSTVKSILSVENDSVATDEQVRSFLNNEQFIKIPFENVPDLVSSRSILIKRGFAYIPSLMQLSLLSIEFQKNLQQSLIKTFQSIPRLDEDDRLMPLLNNLSNNFSNFEYNSGFENNANSSDINANTVGSPAIVKHFPLCMKNLMNGIQVKHHLKYTGRQQFSVFLKAVGLNVDEALKFWQNSFTAGGNMSIEKFNKEYKYNIRHTYGLEGARINYKPWDCGNILSKPKPSKDEYHGCPYRDFSKEQLVNDLNSMGINDSTDITAVLDDVAKHDYTIACTRVFEMTHQTQLKSQKSETMHLNHPNLYFDRSRQLDRVEAKKEGAQ